MYEKGAGLPRRICAFDGDGFLGSREGAKHRVDVPFRPGTLHDVRALCEAGESCANRIPPEAAT